MITNLLSEIAAMLDEQESDKIITLLLSTRDKITVLKGYRKETDFIDLCEAYKIAKACGFNRSKALLRYWADRYFDVKRPRYKQSQLDKLLAYGLMPIEVERPRYSKSEIESQLAYGITWGEGAVIRSIKFQIIAIA